MKNHTAQLPNLEKSKVKWSYPDDLPLLSEDQIQYVKESLDPFILERIQADLQFKNSFINPFTIALKKFNVLKKINTVIENKIDNQECPSDTVMLLLYEDSVKYCAISFSEIIKKLIAFLSGDFKGKLLHLLRRNGLKSIVEKMSANTPENAKEYTTRLLDYQKTWDTFFPNGTNCKNGPQERDVDNLKTTLENTYQKLRAYRDKVAAHFDDEVTKSGALPILLWTELEDIVLQFQGFLQKFHFLLTHGNIQCDELDGVGFTSEETTVNSFISGIFRDATFNGAS